MKIIFCIANINLIKMKKTILILFPEVLIIAMAILIAATQSCKKNPCIYNNCDPEPKPTTEECYVSKKLVREYNFESNGKSWTVYDTDTSYYLQADVKFIGHDSLAANAGVLNIKPLEYCNALYNYATIAVGKDTVVQDGVIKYYCIRVALHYNPVGDPVGDSVLMSVGQEIYNILKTQDKFMYN